MAPGGLLAPLVHPLPLCLPLVEQIADVHAVQLTRCLFVAAESHEVVKDAHCCVHHVRQSAQGCCFASVARLVGRR